MRGAQGQHDHGDLDLLEEDALERQREGRTVAMRSRLRRFGSEFRVLVAFRLPSRSAQHGLAKPLQAEREEQQAHGEPQVVQRYTFERRTDDRDERSRDRRRSGCRTERRAPAAREPDCEHDRRSLDQLDSAG